MLQNKSLYIMPCIWRSLGSNTHSDDDHLLFFFVGEKSGSNDVILCDTRE
jgi:hypothetical protein